MMKQNKILNAITGTFKIELCANIIALYQKRDREKNEYNNKSNDDIS